MLETIGINYEVVHFYCTVALRIKYFNFCDHGISSIHRLLRKQI